jgi:hypothetical protein
MIVEEDTISARAILRRYKFRGMKAAETDTASES